LEQEFRSAEELRKEIENIQSLLRKSGELCEELSANLAEKDEAVTLKENGSLLRGTLYAGEEAYAKLHDTIFELHEKLAYNYAKIEPSCNPFLEEIDPWLMEKNSEDPLVLRFVFPYIGYASKNDLYLLKTYNRCGFTRHMAVHIRKKWEKEWHENEVKKLKEKLGGSYNPDVFSPNPNDTEKFYFDEPFILFVYHFGIRKRPLDADNIETKRFIDVLRRRYFEDDSALILTTAFTAVEDEDDYTEIYLCEKKDAWKPLTALGIGSIL
jgi:hypothetical protein